LIGGVSAGLILNAACSDSKNSAPQNQKDLITKPIPTEPQTPVESQVLTQVIDLDKYKHSEVPVFELKNVEALSKPYIGVNNILVFPMRSNGILFSAITIDPNYQPGFEWGKDARAGFCIYDDSLDPNKVEVLGQIDPPKFSDPIDFELDAIAFLRRTIPDLKYDFLEYQKIPPVGTDLLYLIREGIMIDQAGQPNPRSLVELKVRFNYSDPAMKS